MRTVVHRLVTARDIEADVDWPQLDGWRTVSGWIWLGYFLAQLLLVWLLL